VNPARSAKSTLTSRSSPTEPCPLGLALEGGRQLRGHREVEQLVHPAELAGGSLEQVSFLTAHPLLAEAGQDLGRPPQGAVEVDAGEDGRERSLPPVLNSGGDEDGAEGTAMSTGHSHHMACQVRENATAIIASARRTNATRTASGSSRCRRR
jgi:hypothetical protein